MAGRATYGYRFAKLWLAAMVVIALLADFLACDRPLMASVDGVVQFPVTAMIASNVGWSPLGTDRNKDWYQAETDWALWPLVPYNGARSDLKNGNYRSPFSAQQTGERARHLLGTDRLGRDVTAGLIHGTRVALFVGFGAVLISLLIGVPLGGAAGFFGNGGLRISRAKLVSFGLGIAFGSLYAVVSLVPFFGLDHPLAIGLLAVATAGVVSLGCYLILGLIPSLKRRVKFPTDSLVLQLLELFINVPGLIFLLAILSFAPKPSLWLLTGVMGVLAWPTMARFVRAELLRIRSLPYIEAALTSGVSPWRVLFSHALPNAVGPLTIVVAFAVGSAILAEGFLSFLGIGIPNDVATWGTLLRRSREQPTAWWLAIFPGLMLTLTILSVQVVGDRRA